MVVQTLRTNEPEPPAPVTEPEKTFEEVLDEHLSLIHIYYYYHLVEKAFDTIREKDSVSGKVIPEVVRYEE